MQSGSVSLFYWGLCTHLFWQGKDCFICKKGGHRAKDCPDKKFSGGPYSAKICLKCGQSGHEMFSCKSDYSSDDLKVQNTLQQNLLSLR